MSADYESVSCELGGDVARITLDHPPLNVLDIPMMKELGEAIDEIPSRTEAKLLVVAHHGKAFSAGVDVKDHVPEKVEEMLKTFHGLFHKLNGLTVPTVALVDGAALGGGCELAAFCDIVLASDRALFGLPEIKLGAFAPVAAVILPHLIGRNRALELLLLGDPVDARAAQALGLINRVFPAGDFQTQAQEIVARLASLSRPALQLTKRAVDRALYLSVDDGIAATEKLYLDELMQTEDIHEGLKAFLEKRPPVWKNR